LNDIGGVGNEAECELIIYNKNSERNKNEKNESEKNEINNIIKKEKEDKSYFNYKTEYFKGKKLKNYYCTYLFVRGTVPIKMKIEIESIFEKPNIIMFFFFFFVLKSFNFFILLKILMTI
jgi:hypothetical protein